MGTCPKCGKHIDQVIAEPIVIIEGVEEKEGTAYRCDDDKCAAIFSVRPNGD